MIVAINQIARECDAREFPTIQPMRLDLSGDPVLDLNKIAQDCIVSALVAHNKSKPAENFYAHYSANETVDLVVFCVISVIRDKDRAGISGLIVGLVRDNYKAFSAVIAENFDKAKANFEQKQAREITAKR